MSTSSIRLMELKQLRSIWYLLLLTFAIDPYLINLPIGKIPPVYAGYLATILLVAVFFFGSSEKIYRIKVNLLKLQDHFSSKGKRASLALTIFILLAVFAEIVLNFGSLIFQHILPALLLVGALVISAYKLHKDKKDHEEKMKSDPHYFRKQILTQNLIIAVLPLILVRTAGVFSYIQMQHSEMFYLGLLQYLLSIILFFQTLPSENR